MTQRTPATGSPGPEAASDETRFRELIVYIARCSEGDPRFGSTKLNKLLFYVDFEAYRKLGRSISGQQYQKLPFGPAPRGVLPTLEQLQEADACVMAQRDYHGYAMKTPLALREADLGCFTAQEIDLVRSTIDELWELNGREVSDLSHKFLGWQVAEVGETIPYETVFVDEPHPLTADDVEYAQGVIAEYLATPRLPTERLHPHA